MVRSGLLIAGVASSVALWAATAAAEIRIATAGPMTGVYAWAGERYQRGAGMAVADLNASGGVLGQTVELIVGDDFCDPDQALALARKLASDGVVFVAGHWCSHASIPAETRRQLGLARSAQVRMRDRIAVDEVLDVLLRR